MARKFKYKYGVNTGTFAVTGNAVTFTPGIVADTGVFTLTGNTADLHKNVTPFLDAASGTFVLTGNNATLSIAPAFSVDTGTFALTGIDATFLVNRVPFMFVDAGTFSLTGNDATLIATVAEDVFNFDVDTGEFLVDSSPITFILDIFIPDGEECIPAFQFGAFQFNAFQECFTDEEPPPDEPGSLSGRYFPEYDPCKFRWHGYKKGVAQVYARKQVHDAAVALGRKGGLANRGKGR